MTPTDDLFQEAEKLEEQGALYPALQRWRQLANLQDNAGVYCRLARAAMELDLLDEAEQAFRSALRLDRSLAPAYVGLGRVSMGKKNFQTAEKLLQQALSFREAPSTYCLLGSTQLDLGKTEDARQSFTRALTLDPAYEEAYYNLGVTHRDDDDKEAERLFRKAIELDTEFASAHRELGWLLLKIGKVDGAEHHLRRARQLDPESMWGRVYLANLLWQRGRLQEAREEYVATVLLGQDLGFPRYWFGNFLEAQGEFEEAEKQYREALALETNDADILARLAGVLCKKGALSSAREFLERALKIEPQNKAALKVQEAIKAVP